MAILNATDDPLLNYTYKNYSFNNINPQRVRNYYLIYTLFIHNFIREIKMNLQLN